MGSIYKRGKIWWVKYYHRGKPIRESSKSGNKLIAQKLLKMREKEIAEEWPVGVTVREKEKGSGVWWVFVNHQGRRKAKRVGCKESAEQAAKEIEKIVACCSFENEWREKMPFCRMMPRLASGIAWDEGAYVLPLGKYQYPARGIELSPGAMDLLRIADVDAIDVFMDEKNAKCGIRPALNGFGFSVRPIKRRNEIIGRVWDKCFGIMNVDHRARELALDDETCLWVFDL